MKKIILFAVIIYMAYKFYIYTIEPMDSFTIEYGIFVLKYISSKSLFLLFISMVFIFLHRYLKRKYNNTRIQKPICIIPKIIYIFSAILFFSWFFYSIIKLENIEYIYNFFNDFYNDIKITNDAITINNIVQALSEKVGIYNDLPEKFKDIITAIIGMGIVATEIIMFLLQFIVTFIYKNSLLIFIIYSTKLFIKIIDHLYYLIQLRIFKYNWQKNAQSEAAISAEHKEQQSD